VQPLQVSWGWHPERTKLDERDEWGSTPRARQFEFEGTRDPCAWIAVADAIAFQEQIGFDRIRARIGELTRYARRCLAADTGLTVATPDHPALHGAMTAFNLPLDPSRNIHDLRRDLWQRYRIEVPIIERPDRLLIRLSTHFYNTEEEVDRLAAALPDLLRGATSR
jgi:isopenicillin-N epimerase